MTFPELEQLGHGSQAFTLLYTAKKQKEAVLFIHGLGENRTGIHYIFTELARALCEEGYDGFQFDLVGCGESLSPLLLDNWLYQIEMILQRLSLYQKVHIVGRGIARTLLPSPFKRGDVILFNSCPLDVFTKGIKELSAHCTWDKERIYPLPSRSGITDRFWFELGVEPECIGGLSVPFSFFKHLEESLQRPLSREYTLLSPCEFKDPLYRFQSDRKKAFHHILEVLLCK
jgi:hypothetical protein